jgi:hypothetical protein
VPFIPNFSFISVEFVLLGPGRRGGSGHGEVEPPVGKRQCERTGLPVLDAQRLSPLLLRGEPDDGGVDVHRRHPRSPPGQQAGAVPLPAADVQPGQAGQFGEQGKEGGHGDLVPADVVAEAGEPGPRLGVAVPKGTDLLIVHPGLRRCKLQER